LWKEEDKNIIKLPSQLRFSGKGPSAKVMWISKIHTYGRLIKFSHTIFALPFALAAVLLASRQYPVSFLTFVLILVAMASARSAAMGFNRFADYHYDRLNPRTASRPHVSGQVDRPSVLFFIAASAAVFVLTAALLGRLCFFLSVPVLAILFFYSFTKRFTTLCHLPGVRHWACPCGGLGGNYRKS
jgi:4-hydroxybenzoate polyprenyltransferase